MKQVKLFDESCGDEVVPGRLYNDGGHNIWIEKTTNPRARKRINYHERVIEIG